MCRWEIRCLILRLRWGKAEIRGWKLEVGSLQLTAHSLQLLRKRQEINAEIAEEEHRGRRGKQDPGSQIEPGAPRAEETQSEKTKAHPHKSRVGHPSARTCKRELRTNKPELSGLRLEVEMIRRYLYSLISWSEVSVEQFEGAGGSDEFAFQF